MNRGNFSELGISKATVYLTSIKNSFGATINRWYDGVVAPFQLKEGQMSIIGSQKITRYKYIKGTCSDQSFFECLASQMGNIDECREDDKLCAPFSIPSNDSLAKVIPVCQSVQRSTECEQKIKNNVWPKCLKRKSCTCQYYATKEFSSYNLKEDNQKSMWKKEFENINVTNEAARVLLEDAENTYLFLAQFDRLDWSFGERANEIQVDVYEEFYVWTTVAMIGNVGGQMGLCIGFSLLGAIGFSVNKIIEFWKIQKF